MSCDPNIFKNGHALINLGGDSTPEIIDELCCSCNNELRESKIDWHYQGGRAMVLYIGKYEEVVPVISKHLPQFNEMTEQYRKHEYPTLYQSFSPQTLTGEDCYPPNMRTIGQILNS